MICKKYIMMCIICKKYIMMCIICKNIYYNDYLECVVYKMKMST